MSQMSYAKVVLSIVLNTTIIGAMASAAVVKPISDFGIGNGGGRGGDTDVVTVAQSIVNYGGRGGNGGRGGTGGAGGTGGTG